MNCCNLLDLCHLQNDELSKIKLWVDIINTSKKQIWTWNKTIEETIMIFFKIRIETIYANILLFIDKLLLTTPLMQTLSLHKKWSFLLKISSVNVTKSNIMKYHGLVCQNVLKISKYFPSKVSAVQLNELSKKAKTKNQNS